MPNIGTLTGLAGATEYILDAVHVDAWGNVSAVAASEPFTTAASTAFTDDFNRANGGLETSTDWTEVIAGAGSADIVANALEIGGAGFGEYLTLCEQALANDQYAQIQVAALPTGGYNETAIGARLTDNGNGSWDGYVFRLRSTGLVDLVRIDAGAKTDLPATTLTVNDGDVLRLECQGTTLRGLVNGIEQATTTDNGHGTGRAGIYRVVDNNTTTFDSFEAGDL